MFTIKKDKPLRCIKCGSEYNNKMCKCGSYVFTVKGNRTRTIKAV